MTTALTPDQTAIVAEVFYMYEHPNHRSDLKKGKDTPNGEVHIESLLPLVRSLGLPMTVPDAHAYRKRFCAAKDTLSFEEVLSIVDSFKADNSIDYESHIETIFENCYPMDGTIEVAVLRRMMCSTSAAEGLAEGDFDALLEDCGLDPAVASRITLDQVKQLLMPPRTLV